MFQTQLLQTIKDWNRDPIEDEWLFEKFRDHFVNHMSSGAAFEEIDETVEVLLRQSDESTAIEVLQTLIALARQSDTTEVPAKFLARKSAIEAQFVNFGEYARGKLQELFHHYRL